MQSPPFVLINIDPQGNPLINGAYIFIFEEIMKKLNIRHYMEEQKNGIYGYRKPNGEWAGAVGSIVSNESDILVAPLVMTYARNQAVQFAVPLLHSNAAIIGGSPPPVSTDVAGLAMVFSLQVWVAMLMSLVTILLVSSLEIDNREEDGDQPRLKFMSLHQVYENVFDHVAVLFLEGTPRQPTHRHGRILFCIWWLVILVLANAFCGHFRARMMMQKDGEKIRDLAHLAQIVHKVTPTVWKGTAFEDFFRLGEWTELIIIWKAIKGNNGDRLLEDLFGREALLQMSSGTLVIANEEDTTKFMLSRKCQELGLNNIYFAEEKFFPLQGGFAYRKDMDVQLVTEINKRILWMAESYIPQKMIDKENQGFEHCVNRPDSRAEGQPLDLDDLGGIFLMGLTAMTISVLAFILEVIIGSFCLSACPRTNYVRD